MESTAHDFKDNVDAALADPNLQDSLSKLKVGFSERRRQAAERLPEFEALRDRARDIKNHALANLDFYLEAYEAKVLASGEEVPCEVLVFPLHVDKIADRWKEKRSRTRKWVSSSEAVRMINEPDLCQIIAYFCADPHRFA